MVTTAQRERTIRGVEGAASAAETTQDLLTSVAALIRSVVPYTGGAWLVTDPATTLFTDGIVEHFDDETCLPWFTNELHDEDVHKFRDLVGRGPGVLSRTEHRATSVRWQEIMRPQGLDDEVRLTFDDANGCWGVVELHRPAGGPDFGHDEVGLLAQMAPVVTAGLRKIAAANVRNATATGDAPGLLHVRPDRTVQPLTPSGARWLDLLVPTGGSGAVSLTPLLSLAAGRTHQHLRVRALDGQWVTLHAEPAIDDDGIIVVVSPSEGAEIARVLTRAYGLTDRERDVVQALARGRSTNEIAGDLFVSPHTVRDHVKSALGKVGVSSRSELIATLFNRHYADGFFQNVGADHD